MYGKGEKGSSRQALSSIDHPLLTKEEESELTGLMEAGGEKGRQARDKLIVHNQRLVMNIAKFYVGRGIPLEDLFQIGNIGLIQGIDKFSTHFHTRVTTYVTWWIKQAIRRALSQQTRTIRIPNGAYFTLGKLTGLVRQYESVHGRPPSFADILSMCKSKKLGTSRMIKTLIPFLVVNLRSLDEDRKGLSKSVSFGSGIADTASLDPLLVMKAREFADDLAARFRLVAATVMVMPNIKETHRTVFFMYHQLYGHESDSTLKECGESTKLTRERVRQINANLWRRLARLKIGIDQDTIFEQMEQLEDVCGTIRYPVPNLIPTFEDIQAAAKAFGGISQLPP